MRSFRHILLAVYLLVLTAFLASAAEVEQLSHQEYTVLERVYKLMEKEKFVECLSSLEPLLAKNQPSTYAFSYAALCYGNLGKNLNALKLLKKAVTVYPENSDFWFNLAIFQMQSEDFTGALESYRTLLSLGPEKKEGIIRYNLAFALYSLEKYQEALVTLVNITTGDAVKQHWLLLKMYCEIALQDWNAAEKTGQSILLLDAGSETVWSLLGQIAVNTKKYQRAATYVEIANTVAPDHSKSNLVSNLYSYLSAWNELVRYLRLEGTSHYDIAEKLAASCQYQSALDELEKLSVKPDKESALLKGQLQFALGRNDEAVNQLLQVEKISLLLPEHVREMNGSNKEQRRQRDRLTARAFLLAGQILWLDHKWEQARDVFKKLELLPGYEEMGINLARCMQGLLLEKKTPVPQPGLYDAQLITGNSGGGQPAN